jgi:glycine/D-amino acid oxidase-like deaminating enzyme
MNGKTHIVGAGVAGLSAALELSRQGRPIALYEAARQAGGRCRTVASTGGFAHDNGTHVLFAGNTAALAMIDEIGAGSGWIEPEPEGLPVYDASRRLFARVGLSPWSWTDPALRPEGLSLRSLPGLLRLALPWRDRPVGDISRRTAIVDSLIEPLTVAVLNTDMREASSRRLGMALRRLARPGAARLLVARRGLTSDLIAPALTTLSGRGASLQSGQRLHGLVRDGDRVTGLAFGDRTIALGPSDCAILAVPPWEIARILPDLAVPTDCEPILNLHAAIQGPEQPRFIGLRGGLAQWLLVRNDHLSVTVSSAGDVIDRDARALRLQIWREIAPALAALNIAADPDAPPDLRIVKEKRATIRQAAGPLPQPPVRPLRNLALAGDWIGTLPATIESAVVSGRRAARAIARADRSGLRLLPAVQEKAGSAT